MTPDPDRRRPRGTREPDDASLVAAARDGDRAALEQLLRRHHDRLSLLCRRLCRDRGDAEDATQQALIAIVRGLPRYDGRAEFTTWSYRVATNACLDELRRRSRRPQLAAVEDLAARESSSPTSSDRAAIDPADAVVGTEERSRLEAALSSLEESFRVPVVLRDVADLDYAEIGELLGLPAGTVRSRISRGRAKLATLLGAGNQDGTGDVRTDDAP